MATLQEELQKVITEVDADKGMPSARQNVVSTELMRRAAESADSLESFLAELVKGLGTQDIELPAEEKKIATAFYNDYISK